MCSYICSINLSLIKDAVNELLDTSNSRLSYRSGCSPPSQISPQPRGDTQKLHATVTQSHPIEILPLVSSDLEASGLSSSGLSSPQPSFSQELLIVSRSSSSRHHGSPNEPSSHFVLPPRFYPDPFISGSTTKFILSSCEHSLYFIPHRHQDV